MYPIRPDAGNGRKVGVLGHVEIIKTDHVILRTLTIPYRQPEHTSRLKIGRCEDRCRWLSKLSSSLATWRVCSWV